MHWLEAFTDLPLSQAILGSFYKSVQFNKMHDSSLERIKE